MVIKKILGWIGFLFLILSWTSHLWSAEKDNVVMSAQESYWAAIARQEMAWNAGTSVKTQQKSLAADVGSVAKLDPFGKNYALLLQSASLSASGDLAQAKKCINAALGGIPESELEFFLAQADSLRRAKLYLEAASLFEKIGNQTQGVLKVRSAEGLGDVFRDTHDLEQAKSYYSMALDALNIIDTYKENSALAQRIADKLQKINSLCELIKHGLGFRLYATARRLSAGGRADLAIKTYEDLIQKAKVNKGADVIAILQKFREDPSCDASIFKQLPIESVYVEAAKFYRSMCLIDIRKYSEAGGALDSFVHEMPYGIYRGEALIALGGIALDRGDIQAAIKQYTAASEWPSEVKKYEFDLSTFRVPVQSDEITKAPELPRTFDRFGNAMWSTPSPEAIVNHLTTSWYMEDVLREAFLQRAICRFLTNEQEMAVADLTSSLSHDPLDQGLLARGGLCNFVRLRDGFKSGRFNATAEEISLFKGKSVIPLIRAEISFETEQWEESIARYRDLRLQFDATLSKQAHGYLDYAEASALLYLGKLSEAEKILNKFTGEGAIATYGKDVPSYPRALIAMANVKQRSDPISWLKKAYDATSSSDLRADILLRTGQYYYVRQTPDDDVAASRTFLALIKIVSTDDCRHRAAEQYLAGLSKRSPKPIKE